MPAVAKTLEQLIVLEPQILYEQGVSLRMGDGVPQDYLQAIRLLGLAALQGQVHAQYVLGLMSMRGEGCDKNPVQALMWFYLASGRNETRAIIQSDQLAARLNANEIREAQRRMQLFPNAHTFFRLARTDKDARAMTNLGVMLLAGQGVAQDAAQAVEWFSLAALQQHAQAQCHLATAYARGHGIKKNLREALRLYQLAAAQMNPDAQYHWAELIEHGQGQAADMAKASKLYEAAAEQGQVSAQCRLGFLYLTANRRDTASLAKAHHFFIMAAQQGDAEAQFQLGLLFAQGLGVSQDFEHAAHWYLQAANQRHPKAQFNLGFLCAHGQGVEQDYTQAYAWYRLSILYGNAAAQANLDFIAKKMSEAAIEKALWIADHFFFNHANSWP